MRRRSTVLVASFPAFAVGCGLLVDTSGLADAPSPAIDGGGDGALAEDARLEPDARLPPEDAGPEAARRLPEGAVVFPENGHAYLVVVSGQLTWDRANADAKDLGGHLATITTAAENEFVWSLVRSTNGAFGAPQLGPWLGGFQHPSGVEPVGGWSWVTGEPWLFTSWTPGAPNEDFPAEDYLIAFGSPSDAVMRWADVRVAQTGVSAFVVEFE